MRCVGIHMHPVFLLLLCMVKYACDCMKCKLGSVSNGTNSVGAQIIIFWWVLPYNHSVVCQLCITPRIYFGAPRNYLVNHAVVV